MHHDDQHEESREPDGVGDDGTIPASDDGLAVGVGGESTFEPEEDPEQTAGDDKPAPDHHNAETDEDTVSGGPA